MTREERKKAIEVLDDMKVKIDIPRAAKAQNDRNWALDMAIQALSQEPCTDAVSREAVLDLLEDTNNGWVINEVLHLPPVTPKPIECDDAISREELLKAIDTWDKFGYTETGCFVRITKEIDNYVPYVHLEDVITAIQKLPPVTQKSGKWIDYRDDGFVECPICGHATNCYDDIDELHYCFYCGAKMVEPQESEDKE